MGSQRHHVSPQVGIRPRLHQNMTSNAAGSVAVTVLLEAQRERSSSRQRIVARSRRLVEWR